MEPGERDLPGFFDWIGVSGFGYCGVSLNNSGVSSVNGVQVRLIWSEFV